MPDADPFNAPAEAYERFIGRYGPSLAPAFARFAGVEPGMRALDVGCGTGALAHVLAIELGAAAVRAVEPSSPFAEAARRRVLGLEVVEASADSLPFETGEFDVTLSQLVVNFIEAPAEAAREMARVTRSGGTLAACVWDYKGGMTFLRAFWDAAREVVPEPAAARDEALGRLGDADALAALWADAGLDEVRTGELTARAEYAGFDDLWAPLPTGVGPAGAFVKGLEERQRDRLRSALRARLGVEDEPFVLEARAWAVAGLVG